MAADRVNRHKRVTATSLSEQAARVDQSPLCSSLAAPVEVVAGESMSVPSSRTVCSFQRQMISLRRIRQVRGIKQGHVAQLMGVSQATMSKWETGILRPSPEQCVKFQQIFAARLCPIHDGWVKRFVENSAGSAHLICHFTHNLLAASKTRYREWGQIPSSMYERPLLDDAPDDIQVAEDTLLKNIETTGLMRPFAINTNGRKGGRYSVHPSLVLWETFQLSDGSWVRLVSNMGRQHIPSETQYLNTA